MMIIVSHCVCLCELVCANTCTSTYMHMQYLTTYGHIQFGRLFIAKKKTPKKTKIVKPYLIIVPIQSGHFEVCRIQIVLKFCYFLFKKRKRKKQKSSILSFLTSLQSCIHELRLVS